MNTNSAVNALLSLCPRALTALHLIHDFDFEQDFTATRIYGKFTTKSVISGLSPEIAKHCDNYKVIILSRIPGYPPYSANTRFRAAEIKINGIDIESSKRLPYESRLTNYCRKADFEAMRKNESAFSIVIAQRKDLLKPRAETFTKIDMDGRFTVQEDRYTYVVVRPFGFDGKRSCTVEKHRRNHMFRDNPPLTEVIDASGYLLIPRRDELKRRAMILRAQKKQEAYNASDQSEQIAEIKEKLKAYKNALAAKIAAAETFDELKPALELAASFRLAASQCNRFIQRATNKEFSSIDQADGSFEYTKKSLEEIHIAV